MQFLQKIMNWSCNREIQAPISALAWELPYHNLLLRRHAVSGRWQILGLKNLPPFWQNFPYSNKYITVYTRLWCLPQTEDQSCVCQGNSELSVPPYFQFFFLQEPHHSFSPIQDGRKATPSFCIVCYLLFAVVVVKTNVAATTTTTTSHEMLGICAKFWLAGGKLCELQIKILKSHCHPGSLASTLQFQTIWQTTVTAEFMFDFRRALGDKGSLTCVQF